MTAKKDIHFSTTEDLDALYDSLCDILRQYTHDGPVYLLVDLARYVIEPALFEYYTVKSKQIKEKYVYPDGISGYGFQITRVMVQLSYAKTGKRPPLFKSRHEAEEYLFDSEAKRKKMSAKTP